MIALLFLIVSCIACYGIVERFFPKLFIIQKFGLALLLAVMSSALLGLAVAAILGYQASIAILITLFSAISVKFFPKKNTFSTIKVSKSFLIFSCLWLFFFISLFNKAFFFPTKNGLETVLYTYGDLALHSTYISYFNEQQELSLRSPIFSQERISYPFLLNFYTALLVKMGLSVRWALLLSSTQLITTVLIFLYSICYQITKKAITPWVASLLFFLNGGLGELLFFWDLKQSGKPLNNFITHLPVDYAHIIEKGYFWSNSVTTHLLPQRGFLFGVAFVLAFLSFFQITWQEKKIKTSQLFFISCLVGLTPLFHTHTYLVTFPLVIWFLGWLWKYKKLSLKNALLSLSPAVVLGLIQLLWLASGRNFITLQIGWMAKDVGIIQFWLQNMGVSLVFLILPLFFWQAFKKHSFEKLLIVPSVAIFVLCNLFIFQPNEWDNMKFFLLGYLITTIIATTALNYLWKDIFSKIAIILVVIVATWSGVLSILFVTQNSFTIASNTDVQLAEVIKRTHSDSVFLIADRHNHPAPMLAGRAVVRGYRGWLWTHGVDYTQTDKDITKIFGGEEAERLIDKYDIDFVFIGPEEKRQYSVNENFFDSKYSKFFESGNTTIYKIN